MHFAFIFLCRFFWEQSSFTEWLLLLQTYPKQNPVWIPLHCSSLSWEGEFVYFYIPSLHFIFYYVHPVFFTACQYCPCKYLGLKTFQEWVIQVPQFPLFSSKIGSVLTWHKKVLRQLNTTAVHAFISCCSHMRMFRVAKVVPCYIVGIGLHWLL